MKTTAMAWVAGFQPVLSGIEKPVMVKPEIQADTAISVQRNWRYRAL